jgi:hypothetical protein
VEKRLGIWARPTWLFPNQEQKAGRTKDMALFRSKPALKELYGHGVAFGEAYADIYLGRQPTEALEPISRAIGAVFPKAVAEVGERKATKQACDGATWSYRLAFDDRNPAPGAARRRFTT